MVNNNITAKAKNKRLYPDINIGDMAKVYTKKKLSHKEHISVLSKDSYEVESIDVSHGQHFYKLKRQHTPFYET